ncbi:hypothetical protein NtRootA4_36300 [Arthrobacter sp. NtRootA4]|nr:hypothetical protein NtRootA2_38510 [Arthrobacter sp. NtRootA2]BCW16651.1 hypothetical protein NtRootA4_36300 [Arthrobacter sp. NtRootA4]BCW24984.1 hypothetical protein NtRootC7_38510 [Arthrobacter sp. NtRootC7]BCW29253.1 hypothetical protein NtRootC45_38530 [Arthrobacter sp. NtRootC45]BCW33524.1 hypothetical protein NtRootD5_38550 [Arthrobacter sp. NtRootD5]
MVGLRVKGLGQAWLLLLLAGKFIPVIAAPGIRGRGGEAMTACFRVVIPVWIVVSHDSAPLR